jgi:propionate catabolism operon transcriptional regulator
VPIISIITDGLDIVEAILRAREMLGRHKEVVFVSFREPTIERALVEFSKALNINIEQILYKDVLEIEEIVRNLAKRGVEVIVCPTLVYLSARKYNIKGLIYYSAKVFRRAFDEAIHIAYSERNIKHILQEYKTISNLTNIGIMSCNPKGIITHINNKAMQIFDIKREDYFLNTCIDNILPELNLSVSGKAFENTTIDDKLVRIKNKELLISVSPIMVDGFFEGFVLSCQETKEISTAEFLIRKNKTKNGFRAKYSFDDIVGHNVLLKDAIAKAKSFAESDFNILIQGETGTGKELFAHAIHNVSNRKEGPFITINCTSLSESLLESELFGYEPGAFTGSRREGKIGLFELCHNGTLFIDEIGELSPSVQVKILRFIEEKEIVRVGGNMLIPVSVRIITATNRNMKNEVSNGNFRLDLFQRISVLRLKTIPLRERRDDITELFEFFLRKHNGGQNPLDKRIIKYVVTKLNNYDWPGNIRELETLTINFLVEEKSASVSSFHAADRIIEDFISIDENKVPAMKRNRPDANTILKTLRDTNNNKSEAAKRLGISRTTLWRMTTKAIR